MRTCLICGQELTTANARAVYCGDTCRARASTARKAGLDAPPSRTLTVVANDDKPELGTPVAAATRNELAEADRLDTALGQAALALAARIDAAKDTGSALAAAVKQLQVTLAAATTGTAGGALSRLDQLRARRDQKRHA